WRVRSPSGRAYNLYQLQGVGVPAGFAFEKRAVFERKLFVHDIGVDRARGFQRQLVGEYFAGDFAHHGYGFGFNGSLDDAVLDDDERQAVNIAQDSALDDKGARIINAAFDRRGARDGKRTTDVLRF